MKVIIKKRLLNDLKAFEKSNLEKLKVDTKSFKTGYSNGFVQGFYFAKNWLLIALAVATGIALVAFISKGLSISLLALFIVAFAAFILGATRERVLSDIERSDDIDFQSRAIKAIEERSKENEKTNADDSWQSAYADAIEVIRNLNNNGMSS
jgi:hypothetical protein